VIAAILAGGKSARFGQGIDKCLYPIYGKPMIMFVYSKLVKSKQFMDLYIVTSWEKAEHFSSLGLKVFIDNFLLGPLPAIYQILKMFKSVFVIGCDTPLIEVTSIERLCSLCLDSADACIPRWRTSRYLEPLFAVYRDALLETLETCFYSGEYSIAKCLKDRASVQYIDAENVFRFPYKEVFNVNTIEDLNKLYDVGYDELV